MAKIVRLTESDLNRVIKRIINEFNFKIPLSIKRRYNIDREKIEKELNKIYKKYVKFRNDGNPHENMLDCVNPDFGLMIYNFIKNAFNLDIYSGAPSQEKVEDWLRLGDFVDSYLSSRYDDENKK
jgi:hypothetical protein